MRSAVIYCAVLALGAYTSCQTQLAGNTAVPKAATVGAIDLPAGYTRVPVSAGSYGEYLRQLKLKPDNTVYLYDGTEKYNQDAQYAVLDMDIGNKDLQQCADAAMRLRAEYLYGEKKYDKIRFGFNIGDTISFTRYAEGWRPKLLTKPDRFVWSKTAARNYTYESFRAYLDLVFTYAGTAALHRDLEAVPDFSDIQPGDVLVMVKPPYGHAVTVMDVAKNPKGEKIFMLSQSYMPAQNIHILKNPKHNGLSPWYTIPEDKLETPEWTFTKEHLKRW